MCKLVLRAQHFSVSRTSLRRTRVLPCLTPLGPDPDVVNMKGGAIPVGHTNGMTGPRPAGHALMEAKPCGIAQAVAIKCVGGRMGRRVRSRSADAHDGNGVIAGTAVICRTDGNAVSL